MNIRLLFCLVYLFAVTLISCAEHDIDTTLDDTPNVIPKFGPNYRFFTDSNLFQKYQASRTSKQNNSFTIQDVIKDKENLKIMVNYSGGCSENEFDVVWDGVVNFSEHEKGRVNLIVQRKGDGDNCEALISDTIVINLETYFDNLIDVKNTVITVSNGSSIQMVSSK